MDNEAKDIRPYHECPGFDGCSSNVCPLDPLSHEKEWLRGEDRCRAHKPTRLRIGAKYPELLKYGGLSPREFNGKKRWDDLTPQQKKIAVERLSKTAKPYKLGHSRVDSQTVIT